MTTAHRRPPRRAATAGALATTLVASLLAFAPAAPAEAASCMGEAKSTMTLKSTDHEYEQWTYIAKSGKVTVDDPENLRPVTKATTVKVTVRSCLEKGKRKVRDYQVSHVHDDMKLTIVGKLVDPTPVSGDTGYGVFVTKVTSNAIEMQAVECRTNPYKLTGWDALRGLLSIPFPAPGPVKIGIVIAKKLLPPSPETTYSCAQLGSAVKMKFTLSKKGKASLTTAKTIRSTSNHWQGVCPAYRACIGNQREVVTIKKG